MEDHVPGDPVRDEGVQGEDEVNFLCVPDGHMIDDVTCHVTLDIVSSRF